MKKIITIIAVAMLILSSQAYNQGFTINGKISGIDEGKVTLQARGGSKYATGIENGEFTLKGKVIEPGMHTLRIEGVRAAAPVFVENSKMTFKADKDDFRNAVVSGSKTHDVYAKYQTLGKELSLKRKPLNDAYSAARKAGDEAEMKKLDGVFEKAREEQTVAVEGFIRENNSSVASAYILASRASRYNDPTKLEATINSLDSSLDNNKYVKNMKTVLLTAKKTTIGQKAMVFTQNDPDGKPVSLSDFIGQVVLVDFWAAWCGPCRAENPNVIEAYKKYKSKGFTVLGVSLDKDKDRWLEAIEKDGLPWTQVSDLKYWDNEVSAMYGVRSIPANILVGKDGTILAKNLRGDKLHEKLTEVLK